MSLSLPMDWDMNKDTDMDKDTAMDVDKNMDLDKNKDVEKDMDKHMERGLVMNIKIDRCIASKECVLCLIASEY
jgi:hypothetical protein